ncbi:DEAD/DEAH box helicase [Streptomyces sp. NPDC050560]|uniref:DEAD/DEAH box helicase n=1 Tax=Streptomyces sp. NPDC050560 TaxID=3365630 RepID=UPI0037936E8D
MSVSSPDHIAVLADDHEPADVTAETAAPDAERAEDTTGAEPAAATEAAEAIQPTEAPETAAVSKTAEAPATPETPVTAEAVTAAAEEEQAPQPGFGDLGLPESVVNKLAQNGVTTPFPIQAATIPDALAGKDILGRGRTGSGKTLSFGLPLLATLAGGYTEKKHPRGVVLTPTRELAMQVADALQPYGDVLGLRMKVVCGGTSMGNQIYALERGVDILVATPGRLRDIINRGACSLDSVQIAVLDEADQMADLGFMPEVTELLDQIPEGGQRMLFSATLEHEIDTLVKRYLNGPVVHEVDPSAGAVTTMSHHILIVKPRDKAPVTAAIAARKGRTIIFVRTQMGADRVAEQLRDAGVRADALHGGMTQGARTRTLADFKDGHVGVLVATDVAARGIHVDDIDLVLNVDPAGDHKDYLHRSGRTARAGRSGTVVSLALPHQRRQIFRLMEDAAVDASRHVVGGGGVFDPEVAEITGARSMTEVQAESAGNAARQAEREVKDLTRQLERAQRRAVELRDEADRLTTRAARERGEEPPQPAAADTATVQDPAEPAAESAAPAVTDAPAEVPAQQSRPSYEGSYERRERRPYERRDGERTYERRDRDGDRSYDRRGGGRSFDRRDDRRDDRGGFNRDRDRGGFRRDDRGDRGERGERGDRGGFRRDGERSYDRKGGNRPFGRRDDRGGFNRDRDDRGGFNRDRDDRGGFNRDRDDRGGFNRDRDDHRGGFHRGREERGGFDRDRERGGFRRDDRRPFNRDDRGGSRRDDRRPFNRDDRPASRRDDHRGGRREDKPRWKRGN